MFPHFDTFCNNQSYIQHIQPSTLQVLKCTNASRASDLWSLGVVIFMLITGGSSLFYSRNKIKMQKRTLNGNYNIEDALYAGVSKDGKALVRALLVVEPGERLTGQQC